MYKNLPYSITGDIAKLSQDPRKPRQHIHLSQKQLKGQTQQLPQMIQRIHRQNLRKDIITANLNEHALNLALYKKTKKLIHNYIQGINHPENPLQMLPLKRSINYFKYVSQEFIEYLMQHPHSKRIHVSWRHDEAFIFLRNNERIVVVHYNLPEDFNFESVVELKRFILENKTSIDEYEILF